MRGAKAESCIVAYIPRIQTDTLKYIWYDFRYTSQRFNKNYERF